MSDLDDPALSRDRTIVLISSVGTTLSAASFGLFFLGRIRNPDNFPFVSVLNVLTVLFGVACIWMLVRAKQRMRCQNPGVGGES